MSRNGQKKIAAILVAGLALGAFQNCRFSSPHATDSASLIPTEAVTESPTPAPAPASNRITITCDNPAETIDESFRKAVATLAAKGGMSNEVGEIFLDGETCLTNGLFIEGRKNIRVRGRGKDLTTIVFQRPNASDCSSNNPYRAHEPLIIRSGTGIEIQDLTVDGRRDENSPVILENGKKQWDGGCFGVGIDLSDVSKSTIRDVRVKNVPLHGVSLTRSGHNRLLNLSVENWGNFGVIFFAGSNSNLIERSDFVLTTPSLTEHTAAIIVDDESSSRLSAPACVDTSGSSDNNSILANRIIGNGLLTTGISVEGSDSNQVIENTIEGAYHHGIALASSQFQGDKGGADRNLVKKNRILADLGYGSDSAGLMIRGSENVIRENVIETRGGRGAILVSGPAVKLLKAGGRPDPGFPVTYSYGCPYAIQTALDPARNNQILANQIKHRGAPGVTLQRGHFTFVEGNVFDSNQDYTIFISSLWGPVETTTIKGNSFASLKEFPVHLYATSAPVGGNIVTTLTSQNTMTNGQSVKVETVEYLYRVLDTR